MYRTMENVRRLQHCSLRGLFSQSTRSLLEIKNVYVLNIKTKLSLDLQTVLAFIVVFPLAHGLFNDGETNFVKCCQIQHIKFRARTEQVIERRTSVGEKIMQTSNLKSSENNRYRLVIVLTCHTKYSLPFRHRMCDSREGSTPDFPLHSATHA